MRDIFKPVAGFILLTLSVSCSNGGSGQGKVTRLLPEPGIIHKKIVCAGPSGRSYALYIPGKPSPPAPPPGGEGGSLHRIPVMIAFDPHGDGALPLSLYKDLAEEYGFIMVGSNDSKNGLAALEVKDIVTELANEVRTVYPVDTNRIYLLGFSGGARVAAMAAMYMIPVKGVIGCGAGLGGSEQPVLYKFDYFGIAGTADFNMNEMVQLDEPLSRAGFRHFITTFPGKHAWPPEVVMEDAFHWITYNAMKDGQLKKDEAYISGVNAAFEARISDLEKTNQLIAAADICREAISFAEGLTGTGKFKEMMMILENNPDYKSQVTYRQNILKTEEEEKQELMQALQAKDLNWWKEWIHHHASRITRHENINPEDTLKDRRLLAFLSLFCYMNANAAMQKQDENAALKIVTIYEMADPENPEPNYMRAILLARRSENEAALAQLSIAVSKGFTDKKRLTGQQEFQSMNNPQGWNDLLKTIN